jgi:hypothetical protein
MTILCAISTIRRATSTGIVNNGRKTENHIDSEGNWATMVEEIMFLMREEHDNIIGSTIEERIIELF